MRGTRKALLVFGLSAVMPVVAAAQSMVEHAAAAAGGSVGGVAGKQVSKGISAIFGKLDKVSQKAAETAPAPARPAAAARVPAAPGPEPQQVVRPRTTAAAPEPAVPAPPGEPEVAPAPVPAPAPTPTLAEIAQIQTGASRQEVLDKLGRPSMRITIPQSDGLVEIYQYAANGEKLGSLRLTDGVVSSVRVEAR